MKKLVTICVVLCAVLSTVPAVANITIDFESFPGSFASYTESGVTFSASGGSGAIVTMITPDGSLGIVDTHAPRLELRADIGPGATFVSVDLGDFDADSDRLFLEIFDAGDVSLGYTYIDIPGPFVGMKTLSLSAPNIAYAVFGARLAVNGSSVVADNFTFTPIPAPGAILLGGIGVGLVGWLRRRRAL